MNQLFRGFPEFEEQIGDEENKDLVYLVFGYFSEYILNKVRNEKNDLKKIISFLTEMAESDDLEVQNILVVSIFERLADDDIGIDFAKRNFKNSCLKLFLRTLNGWITGTENNEGDPS